MCVMSQPFKQLKFISSVLERREPGEGEEKEKGEMQVDESADCSGVSSNFWNNSRSRTGTVSTNKPKYFMFSASVSITYTFLSSSLK